MKNDNVKHLQEKYGLSFPEALALDWLAVQEKSVQWEHIRPQNRPVYLRLITRPNPLVEEFQTLRGTWVIAACEDILKTYGRANALNELFAFDGQLY